MKTLKHRGSFLETARLLAVAGAVAAGSLLFWSGCASYSHPHPAPVTVAQIIDMSGNGTPADAIISRIKASGTVYRLKASQLAELEKKGVPAAVIDYMQGTFLDAVKRDADYENWSHWTQYGDYWYGGAPFGWPYDTVYITGRSRESGRSELSEHESFRALERNEPPRTIKRSEPPQAVERKESPQQERNEMR